MLKKVKSIYLTENNQEIQDKLKSLGYEICTCCNFKGSIWLHCFKYEDDEKPTIHGAGMGCENDCPDASSMVCIMCSIKDSIKSIHKHEVHIVNDLESFINLM